jgi:hypothetical protein
LSIRKKPFAWVPKLDSWEAAISRSKRVIGDALRSREDARREGEVKIAVKALNRMLELGRPIRVRVA